MTIGTSQGFQFADMLEARTKRFQAVDEMEAYTEPDMTFSRFTRDRNVMSPDTYMNNKISEDPNVISNDKGDAVDMSTPEQRQKLYDKNNPFETGPNIEDRTKDSLGKTITDIVKGQLTQQKLDDVMSYPLDSSYDRAMKLNADEYFGKGRDLPARSPNVSPSPLSTELGYNSITGPRNEHRYK